MTTDSIQPWGRSTLSAFLMGGIRRKLIRGDLRKAAFSFLAARSPTLDIEVDGLKVRAHFGDNQVERDLIRHGTRDPENIKNITSDLRPGDVFVDIGANCGLYSLYAARKIGETGRVIAIEPTAEIADRMRENIALNDFHNIEVVQAAAGDAPGTISIYVHADNWGQTSAAAQVGETAIEVPAVTIPDIVKQQGVSRIAALKADVEGYEDRAILPIIRELPKDVWPRRILLEVQHAYLWAEPCLRLLTEAGYRFVGPIGEDALLEL